LTGDLHNQPLNNLERERQTQEALKAQEEQLRRENAILLSLIARRTWGEGDFNKAIREMTEACARLIQVERVSIWWYNHDHSLIRCLDLYELSKDLHSSGTQLESSIFPLYVSCHQRGEIISVTDVQSDLRTRAIPDTYYGNAQIRSLLDTPIWLHDRVGGLLSFEHVGERRAWTQADERLSAAMAALISLSFESSEKKLAEVQLRESEEKYRLLAESTDAILWEYDIPTDLWTYLAPQATRILGYAPAEWTGLNFWQEHIHPEDRKWAAQYCADCVKRGEDHIFEYRFIKKNGEAVWLRDYVNVGLREDQPVKLRGFMIDISDRKKAEDALHQLNLELEQRIRSRTAQLEASNRELEAFAYSVSHDLRTPLRAVDGFSRIILEEYGGKLDAEGNRLLRIVLENTRHMDRLIADLLEISRAGRTEMKIKAVDMEQLVHSVMNQLTAAEGRDRLEYDLNSMPVAMADPVLIRQVWINLLENALKFTSSRPVRRIEIGGFTKNEMHTYFVKDNGVGFDPQYTHKLFGIFQRLHSRKEFAGTGIGLAIVQRIVQRHGGQAWAKGAVDEGALFHFSLPVQPKEAMLSERIS
jgi:PAS domain S-box-containing protein